jgi:hypothetical protein
MIKLDSDKHLNIKIRIQVSEVETGKFIDSDDVDTTIPSYEVLEWFTNYGRAITSVFCAKQNVGIRITGPADRKILQIKTLREMGIEVAGYVGLREAKDAIEQIDRGPHMVIAGLSTTGIARIQSIAQAAGVSIELAATTSTIAEGRNQQQSQYVIMLTAKSE